jgi:hypothetical protein
MFGGLTENVSSTFGSTEWSSSYIVPAMVALVAIFIVVIIIFTIFQFSNGRPAKVLWGPIDLFNPSSPVIVDRDTTGRNMTGTYTLSFYTKIDAVPDIRATATPLLTMAGVWKLGYNAAKESMVWSFGQITTGGNALLVDDVTLSSVPLQRWNQVTMTFEGRSVDLYVNGTLITSSVLANVPTFANSSVTIVPNGVIGKIAYIQVWPRRLTVSEVAGNFTDTSDSQGRPYLGPEVLQTLNAISLPNLFCPSGGCTGSAPIANPSQTWEFPYA